MKNPQMKNPNAPKGNKNTAPVENTETETTTVETQAADGTGDQTDENEDEVETLEAFTFETVTAGNTAEIAQAVFARIEGKNYAERAELANTFITAMRKARDEGKVTRPRRSIDVIIQEAIGKPLSELQAIKVPLAGVSLPLTQVIRQATMEEDSPFKKLAQEFMATHKIKAVVGDKSSRGKASTFLRPLDYVEPEAEAEQAQAA